MTDNKDTLNNDNSDDVKGIEISANSNEKVQIIKTLIDEYKDNREALKILIKDLEKLKEKIDTIFPENLDKRYMRFFEEKVKAATQLFSAILQIRIEISKGLKTEIEMRNKISLDENDKSNNLLTQEDIREMAKQLENFQKSEINKKANVIDINSKIGGVENG